jgi:ADP-ribose pyrophosphatase YjhB (NUDIX family)
MGYKKLPYGEFMTIYRKVPRATVEVVVKTQKGIVLTKRSIEPFKGCWHLPGGTILNGEPIEAAIARVAREEIGVEVKIIKMMGTIEYFNDGGRHTIGLAYLTKISKGELRGSDQGEEVAEFETIPTNSIPEQKEFLERNLG